MFIVLQFPFTDARPFLPTATYRLANPVWTSPRKDKDFIRSFGAVKKRLKGGVEEWPSEGFYCRAENALHFDISFTNPQPIAGSEVLFRKHCAFRRFLSDGCAVARIEIGVQLRSRGRALQFSGDQCLSLCRTILSQRVTVPLNGNKQPEELLLAQGKLAKLYLRSSTEKPHHEETHPGWWFSPGSPSVSVYRPQIFNGR